MPLRASQHSKGEGIAPPECWILPDPPERPVVALRDHHTSHQVRVAAQVLRRRVHDQVGPELEGPLQDRRCPGVVAGEQDPRLPGDPRDLADVGDLQAGIGGRLGPEQLRARPHGLADRPRVGHVDEGGLHAPPGEQVPEDLPRPEVGVVRDYHVVAGGERLQDRHRGGHPRREGRGGSPALELPHALL